MSRDREARRRRCCSIVDDERQRDQPKFPPPSGLRAQQPCFFVAPPRRCLTSTRRHASNQKPFPPQQMACYLWDRTLKTNLFDESGETILPKASLHLLGLFQCGKLTYQDTIIMILPPPQEAALFPNSSWPPIESESVRRPPPYSVLQPERCGLRGDAEVPGAERRVHHALLAGPVQRRLMVPEETLKERSAARRSRAGVSSPAGEYRKKRQSPWTIPPP